MWFWLILSVVIWTMFKTPNSKRPRWCNNTACSFPLVENTGWQGGRCPQASAAPRHTPTWCTPVHPPASEDSRTGIGIEPLACRRRRPHPTAPEHMSVAPPGKDRERLSPTCPSSQKGQELVGRRDVRFLVTVAFRKAVTAHSVCQQRRET